MADDYRTESIVVAETYAGERLDRALALTIADLSRSRLKALILAGEVTIGGRTVRDPGHRVNAGDAVTVACRRPNRRRRQPENIPLNVVFEDDEIIVIDKPRGLVVHPAAGNQAGTLVNALIAHCGDSLSGIGGVRRPGIVHRLDKDTTGLMVVAKTDRAHRKLAAQFADHGRTGPLQRGYLAFVWGAPDRPRAARSTSRSTGIRTPRDRWRSRAGRPRGRHPLGGAGALSRQRHGKAGRQPARLPAGDRPHPPDPGASGPSGPSAPRRRRPTGRDSGPRLARLAPDARPPLVEALGRQALHAYLSGHSNTRSPASRWSSARNYRAILARLRCALGAQAVQGAWTERKGRVNQRLDAYPAGVTPT